ncbi:MAG: VanZ family protein [Planctomycetes bacterium]|nr:VanZ family protein [Planctomycetota bacterium]
MRKRLLELALAGYLAMLLYSAWMPLDFRYERRAVLAELRAAMRICPSNWSAYVHSKDTWLNLLVFAVAGLMLAGAQSAYWRWLAIVGWAIVGTAVVSATMEIGQLFVPERIACLGDLAANVLGGAGGALLGLGLFFSSPMLAFWRRIGRGIKGRQCYLAAGVVAMVLVGCTAWRVRCDWPVVWRQWSAIVWSPAGAFQAQRWHTWIVRGMLPYAAITLLLSVGGAGGRVSGRRALLAAWVSVAVAALIQVMHILIPGSPPNVTAMLLASVAALLAALVGPRLHGRWFQLPVVVLAGVGAVVVLGVAVVWRWDEAAFMGSLQARVCMGLLRDASTGGDHGGPGLAGCVLFEPEQAVAAALSHVGRMGNWGGVCRGPGVCQAACLHRAGELGGAW